MTDAMGGAPESDAGRAELPDRPSPDAVAEAELRTFLIADIRGYTTFTHERGADAAAELAGRFAAIVREVVTAHDGFLLELRGDEALVVFVLARRALRASLELQARFAAELPCGVGIGLDAGEAIPVEGGYRGSALNLAARLCSEAGPGETLASEAVIHLAAKVEGVGYADPRTLRLKGIEQPVRAVHVVPADQASKKPIRYGGDGRQVDRRLLAAGGVCLIAFAIIAVAMSGVLGDRGRAPASPGPSVAGLAAASPITSASPDPADGLFPVGDLPLIAFLDPTSGAVTDSRQTESQIGMPYSGMYSGAGYSDGSYWLFRLEPQGVTRIDGVTHETLKTLTIPIAVPGGIHVDGGTMWVTDFNAPRVIGIDVASGIQTHDYQLADSPADQAGAISLTVGAGSLWVGRPDVAELLRVDPGSGKIQARIPLDYAAQLAFDGSSVYATGGGRLQRVDPATNSITWSTQLNDRYLPVIAFGGGYTWTVDDASGTVWKVDQAGRVAGTYKVGVGALPLTPLGDTMWVGIVDTGTIVGIDMVTGATREIEVGHLVYGLQAGPNELLVSVGPTPEEVIAGVDGDVLTIASPEQPMLDPNPDPATNSSFEFRQADFITCAGLLRYRDAPAPDGWVLEPEVAAAMPKVSDDGRTYTFTILGGFVFSPPSGEPLTAATFASTLERAFSPGLGRYGRGMVFLADVEGAADYREGRADHVSGISVEGDQLAITLTAPSPDFLQRLALPYFCPVPRGTPAVLGLDPSPPLAAAGPYYLAKHIAGELGLFLRNPNYHGPRPQPFQGFAFRVGIETGDAISRVESGAADAATAGAFEPLMNAASERARRWGHGSVAASRGDQRWFGGPRFLTEFLALNPADPLLADPRVRGAIALALDRSALATIQGEAPTRDLLAPSVPGSPPAGGDVPVPDLEAARSLMAGRTGSVVLAAPPAGACAECDALASAVKSQLAPIGITVEIRRFGDPSAAAHEPGSSIGLLDDWLDTDYPDPVALLARLRGSSWIPDADLAELDRMQTLAGDARSEAAGALAAKLVDEDHLLVPFGYPVYPMYLGSIVGCGFVQPAIGAVDLLSLCRKP